MEDAGPSWLGLFARTAYGARLARVRAAGLILVAVLGGAQLQAGVLPIAKDKLTDDEKIELLRNLAAEFAKAKTYLPRSKKPLEFDMNGTWDQGEWQKLAQGGNVTARVGDQIKITHVTFEGSKLVLEINGGLKSGAHWYDHIQAGMGNSTRPIGNGDYTPTTGTNIEINFHRPMENLTSGEVKRILLPLMDFDPKSAARLYSETLPPEIAKAVTEKRAVEGMDHDQVRLALGNPFRKYRETKDGNDLEDWIYGQPPGKVTFVTFLGSKVVKVKEQYAGLGIQTAPQINVAP